MLLCKEQKREIIIEGKKIPITDKLANIHYKLFASPITEAELMMYLRVENDGKPAQELIKRCTSKDISGILENSLKRDINHYFSDEEGQKIWDSTPE